MPKRYGREFGRPWVCPLESGEGVTGGATAEPGVAVPRCSSEPSCSRPSGPSWRALPVPAGEGDHIGWKEAGPTLDFTPRSGRTYASTVPSANELVISASYADAVSHRGSASIRREDSLE